MAIYDRRKFLGSTAIALGGFAAHSALGGERSSVDERRGYGALFPAKTENTGETLLALPQNFRYTVFGKTGARMSDGRPTPRSHDGMAAFSVNGQLRLVRNHEINHKRGRTGVALGQKSYDELAGGGATTLIIDPRTREPIKDFVSLSGTLHNCAGGPTPWGSWISCEESTLGKTNVQDNDQLSGAFAQPHGYCFEVRAAADAPAQPVPLKAMGRFVHEALAVDPRDGTVYETEDRQTAGFYRFLPRKPGDLAAGGRLQMLAVKNRPQYDTRTGQAMGKPLEAVWVEIKNPDPESADVDSQAVYKQGVAGGAATFARLEGCWYGHDRIYFSATNGGNAKRGQIWEYTPLSAEDGRLNLLYESTDRNVLDAPDNLCVSPRGGICICEDGDNQNFVRGLTPQGEILDFARNIVPGYENKEFAGATYSPDGQTLFVNVQTPGMTFAIWGPWKENSL